VNLTVTIACIWCIRRHRQRRENADESSLGKRKIAEIVVTAGGKLALFIALAASILAFRGIILSYHER